MGGRTVGVEEEFLLIEPSGTPGAASERAVPAVAARAGSDRGEGHDFARELKREQIESGTAVCATLDDVASEVSALRRELAEGVAPLGLRVAALGTSPMPVDPTSIHDDRAFGMIATYGLPAREMLNCGCHVHVSVESRQEGVAVLDRIRPWLPVLTAIGANSPYWQGEDTGYASYRNVLWNRLPTAGPYEPFDTVATYERAVRTLVAAGGSLDVGTIYFDARLSESYPTVEIRASDSAPTVERAVLLAAVCRALVETAADEAASGRRPAAIRMDLLRSTAWRAARSGLSGDLIDPRAGRAVPAGELVAGFIGHLRPALATYGDEQRVDEAIANLLDTGTGADLQRAAFGRRERLADVVEDAVERTSPSPPLPASTPT